MKQVLAVRNRQRIQTVNLNHLRRLIRTLLSTSMGVDQYELGVHLVGTIEMTRLNETFLNHLGSTDVITFNHLNATPPDPAGVLHGEIFICMDEVLHHARQFRALWQKELVRYVIHGLLHLRGYNDHESADRREMKRAEERLLRGLARQFPFAGLEMPPRKRAVSASGNLTSRRFSKECHP